MRLSAKIVCIRTLEALAAVISWLWALLLLGALASLFWRAYVFLKDGWWPSSLCELSSDLIQRGLNFPNACLDIGTSWRGVNRLASWLALEVDAALALFMLAVVPLTAMMAIIVFAGSLERAWVRRM